MVLLLGSYIDLHRPGWSRLSLMLPLGLILAMGLSGCAGDVVWDKPGATQADLNRDWARCQMGASGIPQPAYQPSRPSSYTGYTNCYGTSCTTTVVPGPDYSGLANGFAALGHILAKERYMENCLIAYGWTKYDADEFRQKVSDVNKREVSGVKIEDFVELPPDRKEILVTDAELELLSEPDWQGYKKRLMDVDEKVLVLAEHPTGWIKVQTEKDKDVGYVHRNWWK